MKRAQMEMVGLMLLVIIAGLAISISLIYMSSSVPKEPIHKRVGEKSISSNFVTVLAKTHIPQCNTDYSTLVKDCATNYDGSIEDGRINCGVHSSCYYVNQTAAEIIQETIARWGLNYRFKVQRGETILEIASNCGDNDEKEAPGRYPIPLYPLPDEAIVILEICRS